MDFISPAKKLFLSINNIASSIESKSEHPIAQAIVNHAKSKKISFVDVEEFKNHSGFGISAKVENKNVLIGNAKFVLEKSRGVDEFQSDIDRLTGEAKQ